VHGQEDETLQGVRSEREAAGQIDSRVRALVRWLRGAPPEALLIGIGLFVVLAAFAGADPAPRVSFSSGPLGDEAYNVISARNLVLLGHWATDAWDHHFVNLPFSLIVVATYKLFGIGMVQARLVMILCTSLTAAALTWGLRRPLGRVAATFAGVAFATSGMILYYGRLAFLEDLVILGITLGALVLAHENRISLRGGVLAGICFAIAIGTKPNSAFEVIGILVALAVAYGRRDMAMRRWLIGAFLTLAAAGAAWGLIFFLPNREAITTDIAIWQPSQFYLTPAALVRSIGSYVAGNNDHLYGMLLGPLIALSAAGLVAIVALRKRLSGAESRLAVAAFGWALFGFGILTVTSYRPNRYVEPIVPALAILAGIGLHLTMMWLRDRLADTSPAAPAPRPNARARRLTPAFAAVLAILLAATPGLFWYARWAHGATYNLVKIEAQLAADAPAGQTIAGNHTALFLLTSSNRLVVTGIANNGDLYAAGVRWYLAPTDAPAPVGVPTAIWAARKSVSCVEWQGRAECLYQVQ
jgi:4-amino-4-deoxy-L-arabinose transferase-like glycosyltransferase